MPVIWGDHRKVRLMQAIVQDEYGKNPEKALRLAEIEKPVPGDDDVLVRVRAASIHIGDWHVMTGLPYMLRVVGFGLRKPKVRVRGVDVAGTVEAVGSKVDRFRVGDDVFGTCEGAFAEYACAPQGNFAHKPTNLTFEQAAVVPTSALAALQGLRDKGEVQKGTTRTHRRCIGRCRVVRDSDRTIVRRGSHGRLRVE